MRHQQIHTVAAIPGLLHPEADTLESKRSSGNRRPGTTLERTHLPGNRSKTPSLARKRSVWLGIFLGLAAVAVVPAVGGGMMQNSYPHLPPELNRVPDSNQANDINSQQAKNKSFEAANAARKKQIIEDTAMLLKLATDLKTEVDKTNQNTLSVGIIRKADEIEKLAHGVKEKMKLTMGPS